MKNNRIPIPRSVELTGTPTWLFSPSKLPFDAALLIADLAGVRSEERENCANVLRTFVQQSSGLDSRSLSINLSPAVSQAADAARELQAAVCNLTNQDRQWLQEFAFYDGPHLQELVRTLPKTISRLATLLGAAIGRYSPEVQIVAVGSKKRGRKHGTFNDPILHRVVENLLLCMFAFGAQLTLDKNFKKGTLIDALNILRPHFPTGVIPNVLPLGTLQKIKTGFYKCAH